MNPAVLQSYVAAHFSSQVSEPSLAGRGLLEGMVDVPLDLNCTPQERAILSRFLNDFKSRSGPPGLRFSSCKSLFSDNRVEGKLMAMACRLMYGFNARVLPAAEVAEHLSRDKIEPLLEDEYIFIT